MRTKDTTKYEIICKCCKGSFYVTKYLLDKGKKFCSAECRWQNVELSPRKNQARMVQLTCSHCKQEYSVKEHLQRKRQFCSTKCANDSRKDRIKDFECIHCKKVVKIKQSSIETGRKYCSAECYRNHITDQPRQVRNRQPKNEREEGKRQTWAKPLPLFGSPW